MSSAAHQFTVKWGMVIDIDKCTGCGACQVACEVENNLPPITEVRTPSWDKTRTMSWMSIYQINNGAKYPDNDVAYLPRPCMQCENPSCTSVCPVIATEKTEEGGIVSQIYPRCIGCRYCMGACPYHVRIFNWYDPAWPAGMEKTLTPFTSTRPRGVVEKCHFCHHRFNAAKERARQEGVSPLDFPEEWYQPACVQACPSGAMIFGDLNNPNHRVHELAHSLHTALLLEKLGTKPQVHYYSTRPWVIAQLDNHLAGEAHGGGSHG